MLPANCWIIFASVLLLVLRSRDVVSLKNVTLTIEPPIVHFLNHSTLRCSYDLEGGILYTLKWYRGPREFYRYTPREEPRTKIFPLQGLNVDENSSTSTQVVLRNITFDLSGNFSCEVTTEPPHMVIGTDERTMIVIQLPSSFPKISVGHELLDAGDILRANCSCPPSRPPVHLQLELNGRLVAQNDPYPYRRLHERSWSDVLLILQLEEAHFDNGRLILRCIAQLPGAYRDEVELELNSARKPVPQKVRGLNGVKKSSEQTKLPYILLCYFLCRSAIVGLL